MCIGLEDKLSPQLHVIAVLVPLVDQDRVVIVKLGADKCEQDRQCGHKRERKTNGTGQRTQTWETGSED